MTDLDADMITEQDVRWPDRVVVGVDIGGTTVKGAVFDSAGAVLDRAAVPTFGPESGALDAVVALLARLCDAAAASGGTLAGVGIASPGLVDSAAGRIVYAANLDWNDLPLVDLVTKRFGVPVALEHDSRAATRAEQAARIAAGRDGREFVFIPIGTGVSASVVTEGRILRGATGGAGEFGHIVVVPNGERCTCGQLGCLEVYASASGLVRRYRAAGGTLTGGAREIAESTDSDTTAAAVWSDAVMALGRGIAMLTALLDPAAVVIGGGLGEAGERLLVPLRAAVAAQMTWRSTPHIEQSLVGAGAGLAGAALLIGPNTGSANSAASNLSSPGPDPFGTVTSEPENSMTEGTQKCQ